LKKALRVAAKKVSFEGANQERKIPNMTRALCQKYSSKKRRSREPQRSRKKDPARPRKGVGQQERNFPTPLIVNGPGKGLRNRERGKLSRRGECESTPATPSKRQRGEKDFQSKGRLYA